MALIHRRSVGARPARHAPALHAGLVRAAIAFLFLLAVLPGNALIPSVAHAVDSRIEKARQIREEILARRPLPARRAERDDADPAGIQREDPHEAALVSARARLAELEARIEESRRRSEGLASPREKLAARAEELAAAVAKVGNENRARVDAVYRSAKLGAGAAGWHPERAKSARLTRYLAAIAAAQHQSLARVEVEHGSVIAALDRARAEDVAAASQLHVLEADRSEAIAALDRVTAGGTVGGYDSVVSADAGSGSEFDRDYGSGSDEDADAGTYDEAVGAADGADAIDNADASDGADDGDDAIDDAKAAADQAEADAALAQRRVADVLRAAEAEKKEAELAAQAVELALAKATAKLRKDKEVADAAARAAAQPTPAASAAAPAPGTAKGPASAAETGEFRWPASAEPRPTTPGGEEVASIQPGGAVANAAAAAARADDGDGAPPELEDGPAVLAPSSDPASAAAAAPDGAPPARQPKGLLSRLFGDDRDSDKFAASRGKLAVPVAGKVVANYGQQHKSGATYRGAILRAAHGAPIKTVAEGRVSFVGVVPGLGNTVIVSHGTRYHTVYARLGSVRVKEGEKLAGGTQVGELPEDDADMHFELRDKGKAIDPVPWLRDGVPGAAR